MVLCSLEEITMLLINKNDLVSFLREKVRAAVIEKKPYFEILG